MSDYFDDKENDRNYDMDNNDSSNVIVENKTNENIPENDGA